MGKCCFIEFKTKNKNNKEASPDDDTHQLILDDIPIKKVKATKFLGITIDEELNWNQHFTDLKRKLYHSLSTLNRIKHCVPDNLHKDLYFTLFESHLGYGISVWGGSPQSKLDKIHKIQKKVIRIMFGDTEAYQDKFKTCARTREFVRCSRRAKLKNSNSNYNKIKIYENQNIFYNNICKNSN